MRIENGFDVQASQQAAWALLTDVPRVVPCMPGARLERTIDDQTWEVLQTVKLGPISLQFRSEVKQEQLSEADGIAVLAVKAKEVKGKGGAEATIRSSLQPTEAAREWNSSRSSSSEEPSPSTVAPSSAASPRS